VTPVRLSGIVSTAIDGRDPRGRPSDPFTYVDIASIHPSEKRIFSAKTLLGQDAPSRARRVIRAGDILVSTVRPNLNAVALVPANLDNQICSTGICVLRPTNEVLSEYLYYFVQSPGFVQYLSKLVSGAMYPAVTDRQVLNSKLPLPSSKEQRRIVDMLARAESIVRLRRQAIKLAEEAVTALFDEMFGTFPATSAHLCDVAEVVSGVAKGRRFNGRHTVMVPYLRVANVQAGHLNLSEIKEIEALPEEVEELTLRKDDVLLTEGGDEDKLGRGALWDADIQNCIHQNHIFRVRVNSRALTPLFFVNFLQTVAARAYFLRSAKRTTNLASINMTQLRSLPVPVPPIGLQRDFEDRCRSVQSIIGQACAARAKAEELFQSLLHLAYRGEL
jgi:type I restriction enzyme S subunit